MVSAVWRMDLAAAERHVHRGQPVMIPAVRRPPLRPGDVLELRDEEYMFGEGTLLVRVVALYELRKWRNGHWVLLGAIELWPRAYRRRDVLVRVEALRTQRREPFLMTDHRIRRPQWTCLADGEAWPCENARQHLRNSFQGIEDVLAAHLATLMSAAADDLKQSNPAKLYRRFVHWALEEKGPCARCGKPGHRAVPGLPPRLFPCVCEPPAKR
jgi:hypothetical protein